MSDSLIAAIMGYTLFFVILVIGLAVVSLVAYWKIFVKAGKEGWEGIIPIYNVYKLFEISWDTRNFWIYIAAIGCFILLSPFSSSNAFVGILTTMLSILQFVWMVRLMNHISISFGKSTGFTIGLVLLNFIFILILAFGDAKYQGNNGNNLLKQTKKKQHKRKMPGNDDFINSWHFLGNITYSEP